MLYSSGARQSLGFFTNSDVMANPPSKTTLSECGARKCAMKKDNLVKTTWRIPADLYEGIIQAAEREKISINAEGITRLRASAISDRFDRIDREIVTLKKMIAELLDKP